MTLFRKRGESQRAFVERTFREQGSVATFDVLYQAAYEDGAKTSITRLAAIVADLRTDGWDIDTKAEHGSLAVYRLRTRSAWRCVDCGAAPLTPPAELLGDLGRAVCANCGRGHLFRRAAA